MVIFAKKRQVKALPQRSLVEHQMQKQNMYLYQPIEKDSRGQTESLLTEMKETMDKLKILAWDTSSKEILDYLKEKSQRQIGREDVFLKIMGALVQQPHPVESEHPKKNSEPNFQSSKCSFCN